jgi:PTS system trehalose-specific IIC component
LILGFRNILEGVPFGFLDGQTIVEVSQFWNGVNSFLWFCVVPIFFVILHVIPTGKKWKIASPINHKNELTPTTKAAEIPFWDFGFAQVNMIGYQAQVIPAMLAGFLLAYLEIFFRKVIRNPTTNRPTDWS